MGVGIESKKERYEVIADLIRDSSAPLKVTDIMDLTGKGKSTIYNEMKKLKELYPQVVGIPSVGYVWKDEKMEPPRVIDTEVPRVRDNEFRNSEGYSDPTAALAMRMMEPKETRVDAGDIWEIQQSTVPGSTREWLIVVVHDTGWCNCLEVYDPHERPAPNSSHIYHFPGEMQNYYVDCRRITSKPLRAFEDYQSKVSNSILEDVRLHIANAMCAQVPVKNDAQESPDVSLERDVERLLIEQEAKIYKECFFALARRA